jgi:hypothetical protein
MPDDDVRQGVIGIGRVDLIRRIAVLWRNAGADEGANSLTTALYGDADQLRALDLALNVAERTSG